MKYDFLKNTMEALTGNQISIERSTELSEVASLLQTLRPRAIKTPLVRIGSANDGGYLLPEDLVGIEVCVSPGVSEQVSFDEAMANRGMHVFMADASVEGPPVRNENFHFTRRFLDVFEDEKHTRLDTLCRSIPAKFDADRILQMDIEGAEFRVLLDASRECLMSFRIMVIEFHHLTRMFGRFPFDIIKATFEKLLQFHHVVHVHPNNVCQPTVHGSLSVPPVMEFTFYRKDRADLAESLQLQFPHRLDADNLPGQPTVVLPDCWR